MKILSVVPELLHDKRTDRYDKANTKTSVSLQTTNRNCEFMYYNNFTIVYPIYEHNQFFFFSGVELLLQITVLFLQLWPFHRSTGYSTVSYYGDWTSIPMKSVSDLWSTK